MNNAITQLQLINFTKFSDITIDFSKKINIIIGENGTGKTHILKAAYGICTGGDVFKDKEAATKAELEAGLTTKLLRIFMPLDKKIGKMRRHGINENAQLIASFELGEQVATSFHANSKSLIVHDRVNYQQYQFEPVFIPTKEVLSLVKGMNNDSHDQVTVELIFDDTYVDISRLLLRTGCEDLELLVNVDPRLSEVIPKLVNLVGGRYYWEQGEFCFQYGNYQERETPGRSKSSNAQMYQDSKTTHFVPTGEPPFASSMTAEGFKKIGMLHRLLSNGTLNPGSSGPLFWDEPESNLNPKLMKMLVNILLELSRNGQQIILATHDYVLLKWFDILMDKGKGDHIRFHSLHQDAETGEVKVEKVDEYSLIRKSAISDAFADLYDEDVKRALG